MVLIEKATGTWCPYCPGSAKALHHLHSLFADSIAIFEYHYGGGDIFENAAAVARVGYYAIQGYPTAIFNGTHQIARGALINADWKPLYDLYEQSLKRALQEKTAFSLHLKVYEIRRRILQIVIETTYEAVSYLKDYRLFLALNESGIPYQWQQMDSLQFVERDMIPDYLGKVLYTGETAPTKGFVLSDTITYRLPTVVQQGFNRFAGGRCY